MNEKDTTDKTRFLGKPEGGQDDSFASTTPTSALSRKSVLRGVSSKQHAYLEIVGPDTASMGVELDQEEVEIGRSSQCKVQLVLDNISRRHAKICFRNEEYLIEDLGSTNGIFVNGVRVTKCVLRNNDQIEIGEARIHFIEERKRGT